MRDDWLVSVVAAVQDDAPIVRDFIAEVHDVLAAHYAHYELIVVDDGSTDGTLAAAEALLPRYPCVRVIRLSRRFGLDVATAAGLDTAIGDFVVVMRPRSDPPAEVPAL